MRLVVAVGVALAAMPVSALEVFPDCEYNPATGKLVPYSNGNGVGVYVERVGPGVAGWTVYNQTRDFVMLAVVQHCASGRELAVVLPEVGNATSVGRWSALVHGEGAFTMQQLAQEMERMGAKANFRNGLVHGRCACEKLATW